MKRLLVLVLAAVLIASLALTLWQPAVRTAGLDPTSVEERFSAHGMSETGGIETSDRPAEAAETAAERLEVAAEAPRSSLRVFSQAEFFARMRELGLDPSRSTFARLHDQRPDLGALAALVTDPEGQFVAGARVVLEIANQETMRQHVANGDYSSKVVSSTTAEDGVASFENVEPGTYLLAAEHRDYVTHYVGSVDVPAGTTTYVEIALEGPDAFVAGRVRDERGTPIADVTVTARRYIEGGAPFQTTTATDYAGKFRLGVQKNTQNVLVATRTGYRDERIEAIAAGTDDVEITLRKSPTVSVLGHVMRGNTGEAVTSFTVDGEIFHAMDGSFRVERNVRPGSQSLRFAAPGFDPRTVSIVLADERDVDLGPVPLFGGRELNGIVLRKQGESMTPVAGAMVSIRSETGTTEQMSTSAAGAFSFRLASDRVLLSVQAVGLQPHQRTIDLIPDQATYVEITLLDGEFEARGTIVDGDTQEPLANATVTVQERPGLVAVTDAGGGYRLTGIDTEQFTLRASKAGYRPSISPPLTGGSEPATWDAALIPSGLRLRLSWRGAPAPAGIPVVLWRPSQPTVAAAQAMQAQLGANRQVLATDERGTVTFDVEDGPWFVQVVDYRLHPTRVVADQSRSEWIDITLPGQCLLTGRIVDADGNPVGNTSLWLHSGDQDYSTMFLYHTDAAGNYAIDNLAPRPYALSIIKSSTVQSAQHLVVFTGSPSISQTLNVQFPPMTASIHGRVTDGLGQGRGGIQVGVEYLDAPHRSILAGWVMTAPDGTYAVPLLEAGNHRVRTAWTDTIAVFSDVVHVAAGEQVQVDLVAPNQPGLRISGTMIAADGGPLGGNFVFVTDPEGRQNGNFFSTMDWAYTGNFLVKGLAPGTHTLTLTAMGCRKKDVTVQVGGNVSGLVVVMEREAQ